MRAVTLMVPATDRRVELSAIVYTGADGTLVPIRYPQRIETRRAFEAGAEQSHEFVVIVDDEDPVVKPINGMALVFGVWPKTLINDQLNSAVRST